MAVEKPVGAVAHRQRRAQLAPELPLELREQPVGLLCLGKVRAARPDREQPLRRALARPAAQVRLRDREIELGEAGPVARAGRRELERRARPLFVAARAFGLAEQRVEARAQRAIAVGPQRLLRRRALGIAGADVHAHAQEIRVICDHAMVLGDRAQQRFGLYAIAALARRDRRAQRAARIRRRERHFGSARFVRSDQHRGREPRGERESRAGSRASTHHRRECARRAPGDQRALSHAARSGSLRA